MGDNLLVNRLGRLKQQGTNLYICIHTNTTLVLVTIVLYKFSYSHLCMCGGASHITVLGAGNKK